MEKTNKTNKIKIDILSDIHVDFWVKSNCTKVKGTFQRQLNGILSRDAEVLIIAGDLGHYNFQATEVLKDIKEKYNYKKIICVLGNHDLYLVSNATKNNYKNSRKRMEAWYDFQDPDIKILNGEIYEYKGIKFGGFMGWYDGSYSSKGVIKSELLVLSEWQRTMNDSRLIYGMGDMFTISKEENEKAANVLEADVIISHVCPVIMPYAFQKEYRNQKSSKFYAFNGEEYTKKTKAKHWVYGHSHGFHEFEHQGILFTMNALGYPGETGAKRCCIEMETK